jgi:uncharacterized protein (TIGR02757 family)
MIRAPSPRLGRVLAEVIASTDRRTRRDADPLAVVHEQTSDGDRELAALLASSLAFGNAIVAQRKAREALALAGTPLGESCDDAPGLRRKLRPWKHRVYVGDDAAGLLLGARAVQRASGSLGDRFAADLAREGDLRPALAAFVDAVRSAGGLARGRRGADHILPDPMGASGCKRLLLFLRWMVRPDDGVDLGLWSDRVPTSVLLMPIDTHLFKLSKNLGLTHRSGVTWATAEEVTASLRRIDADDPVRFDFALCHLGMVQRCPSRRDAVRCEGCGVRPLCVHWRR